MSRKSVLLLSLCMMILWALNLPAQWRTPWSYSGDKGPGRWGDLDPDYAACKTGHEQSPIDIRETQKADLPVLRFEYRNGPIKIINNGYTAVRINYTSGNGNYLFVGDRRYELSQFHFHHPSEESIRGKSYEMVLHLMHRAEDSKVAGVAIFLTIGSKNSMVEELWKHMPQSAGPEHEIPGLELNPAGLLPHDLTYYTYMGSQTAPPCTEGVTWFVVKQPLEISAEQVNTFAKLYPHDVRPIQPLNGRIVQESR